MRISAELSLYPLHDKPLPVILAFIDQVMGDEKLEVVVNQMSTQITGELGDVTRVIHDALERSFASGHSQVLVAKYLATPLPIDEVPILEAAG